ncbi:hypothetical protein [Syntrophobacter fumaroxidans]|uniref:Uncharacterized protein n=1 Tax=Syntrophobacter fumaroxidans (strain DSM 10017 / MPOB) TaxID=335543 RepID=A0LL04_SYNFM|nr:hypothetical protein [Syntrophobacter fumaroxidans]ABK18106.1 hypothetical protein Sfum_2426 [Syntrophobacter fumaroxidans MPOB]
MPKKTESLPELVARLKTEKILAVLALIDAERAGLLSLPDELKDGDRALTYDLGLFVLALFDEKRGAKWQELQVLRQHVIPQALDEIEALYSAIKEIGLKDYVVAGEDKTSYRWRDAVLKRYDANKTGFRAIERGDLQDLDLYDFRMSKEHEDFKYKLLQKILLRIGFRKFGIELLKSAGKPKPT